MKDTIPKPFVFVLMPFQEEFDDIYQIGIKEASKNEGAYCERVDEQIFQESILSRIYNQIGKADIIVADMTGRNPNVFYEVGYSHALGKNVVLLTNAAEDIPFDLKHYPHVIYKDSIVKLKEELSQRLKHILENNITDKGHSNVSLTFTLNGEIFNKDRLIKSPINQSLRKVKVVFGIKNSTEEEVNGNKNNISITLPSQLKSDGYMMEKPIEIGNEQTLHKIGNVGLLYPHSWNTCTLTLSQASVTKFINQETNCVMTIVPAYKTCIVNCCGITSPEIHTH